MPLRDPLHLESLKAISDRSPSGQTPPARCCARRRSSSRAACWAAATSARASRSRHLPAKRGGTVSLDEAEDVFPMYPVVASEEQSRGALSVHEAQATYRLASVKDVVTNVAPGERTVGAEGGRGRVVYAKGASMEPHIKDGWAVLVVDQPLASVREVTPGWIYAIRVNGTMLMKHIVRDAKGRWVARSSNRGFADIPLENGAEVVVAGPIRWAGSAIGTGE